MKIKPDDYLGLGFARKDNTFRNTVRMSMLSSLGDGIKQAGIAWTSELMHHRQQFTDRILSVTGWNHYLLTAKAIEIAAAIKVEKTFNYGLLRTLRAQQSCYLLGKDEFFRFYVEPDGQPDDTLANVVNANFSGITIMHMRANHEDETVSRTSFNIDYDRGIMTNERLSDLHWNLAQRLLQLIIFVEMSEPEILLIENNATSNRNPAKPWEAPIKNQSGVAITRVHSDWNKFIIHTAEIGVKGFLRLQACGPQWSLRKLTWVRAHSRKGFVRPARGAKSLS